MNHHSHISRSTKLNSHTIRTGYQFTTFFKFKILILDFSNSDHDKISHFLDSFCFFDYMFIQHQKWENCMNGQWNFVWWHKIITCNDAGLTSGWFHNHQDGLGQTDPSTVKILWAVTPVHSGHINMQYQNKTEKLSHTGSKSKLHPSVLASYASWRPLDALFR